MDHPRGGTWVDPLDNEEWFPDAAPMSIGGSVYYYPGCEGLTDVINGTYINCTLNDFRNTVPLNAYAYYCAVLVYAKLLRIKQQRDAITLDESRFLQRVEETRPVAPKVIATYIAALGNFTPPHTGREATARVLPVEYAMGANGQRGYFGRVSAETHFLYRMYPCVAVYLQNVVESVQLAEAASPHPGRMWNLPENIRPEDFPEALPTANLLGWTPLIPLMDEQRRFLKHSGCRPGDNPTVGGELPLNFPLFGNVKGMLSGQRGTVQINEFGVDGSVGQLLISKTADNNPVAQKCTIRSECSCRIDTTAAYLAAGLRFRMRYEVKENGETNCSVYGFPDHRLPIAWVPTVNTPRHKEGTGDWASFVMQPTNTEARISEWIRTIQ